MKKVLLCLVLALAVGWSAPPLTSPATAQDIFGIDNTSGYNSLLNYSYAKQRARQARGRETRSRKKRTMRSNRRYGKSRYAKSRGYKSRGYKSNRRYGKSRSFKGRQTRIYRSSYRTRR